MFGFGKKDNEGKELTPVNEVNEDIIHPAKDGFKERITAKTPDETIHFYKCPCGKSHFRHAGYMKSLTPFMRQGGEKRVDVHDVQVMICVSCKKAFVWINEQMYDVTDQIDVKAWEKTEKEAYEMTGPGGQC